MATKIAKRCAYDCLKWSSSVSVVSINKTSPLGVNFDNGEMLAVEWDTSDKTASASWSKDNATRGGASFTYSCDAGGNLVLTITGSTP